MLRAFLELCRISNLPTVWTNVTAAWIIACSGMKWCIELLWLLIGASLVYCAGMILNDACDAAWDRDNRPERPIPSGRISLRTAWALGIGGLLGGYALMVFAGGAGPGITAALVGAIVLYDVYHKPWAGSVIVMGACRTLLYLAAAGSAMVTVRLNLQHLPNPLPLLALLSGTLVGTYVVALTLTARAEGKKSVGSGQRWLLAALLMLPAAWVAFWIIMSRAKSLNHAWLGEVFVLIPMGVFVGWTIYALGQMRKGGPAIGNAVGLLLAGIPLVDALMVVPVAPTIALGFCCLPPLLRYWQRWVAAT